MKKFNNFFLANRWLPIDQSTDIGRKRLGVAVPILSHQSEKG